MFFLHISIHTLLGLHSLGSAEANIGWGGKLTSHLMASCVRNIHTWNYYNLITFLEVAIESIGDVFLWHSVCSLPCVLIWFRNFYSSVDAVDFSFKMNGLLAPFSVTSLKSSAMLNAMTNVALTNVAPSVSVHLYAHAPVSEWVGLYVAFNTV